MSFIIRPLPSILDLEPKLVCCTNGRTPIEYASATEDDFDVTETDNGDGTFTTEWVMKGSQTPVFGLYFTMCCEKDLILSVYVDDGATEIARTEVYLGGGVLDPGTLVFSQEGSFSDINVSDEELAADFFPYGPCGLVVTIVHFGPEDVGDTITMTI